MPKTRSRLLDRVQLLEDRVTPSSALSFDEAFGLMAEMRSAGQADAEVIDSLEERDPTLLRRGFHRPAEYSIHDCPLMRLPGKWAARHSDPFVSIVGRLDDGGFSVRGPGDDRHPVRLPSCAAWRNWEPIVVFFLGLLVHHEKAWTTFWSRSPEVRARIGIVGFYIGTAARRAARLRREEHPDVLADFSARLKERIEWIVTQEEEPVQLPWNQGAAT